MLEQFAERWRFKLQEQFPVDTNKYSLKHNDATNISLLFGGREDISDLTSAIFCSYHWCCLNSGTLRLLIWLGSLFFFSSWGEFFRLFSTLSLSLSLSEHFIKGSPGNNYFDWHSNQNFTLSLGRAPSYEFDSLFSYILFF